MIEDDEASLDLFQEPEGYFQPEKPPTFEEHVLADGRKIDLRLVGHNPLWGHLLWHTSRSITGYLEEHRERLVKGRTILELGAGSGLPSLVCALLGARYVLSTDYPDADLIENLQYNIDHCTHLSKPLNIEVQGYLWGADTANLHNPDGQGERFETLLLADILFNHSETAALVKTVRSALARSKTARAIVFFTPHRPWLYHKDMAFFELAKTAAKEDQSSILGSTKVLEQLMDKPMFENERGDYDLRRTVFGYEVFWQDLQDGI